RLRRALYRLRGLEALAPLVTDETERETIRARTLAARTKARRMLAGTLAAGLLFMPALLAGVALTLDPKPATLATATPAAPAPLVHQVIAPEVPPTLAEPLEPESL